MAPAASASSGVASLVASIKQHKKFRQLAAYSVQCLGKVITPPHTTWERNLKEAYENGAMEAITDVLGRHSADEDVRVACTSCLTTISTNPKYAAELVNSGAMMQMLQIVMQNPDGKDGISETLQLMETIATNNPEALLAQGFADACTRLITVCPTKAKIVAACVRTMEKLNKVPGGSAALIEVDGVRTIMGLIKTADSTVLDAAFRLLDRMCRAPEHAEYLRVQCDALQVLSSALETNKDQRVTKLGGRLLAKLASGSVSDLIGRMEATGAGKEKEFLAGLLANLALEEENADKIVASGGINALVHAMEGSTKALENAARCLGRLAISDDACEQLFSSGAANILVKALVANSADGAVAAAIIATLTRIASSPDRAGRIARTGGAEAVVKALTGNPSAESMALEAFIFLEAMACNDVDLGRLQADYNAIGGIAAALKAFTANAEVQLAGLRALIVFSGNETGIKAMVASGVVERTLALAGSDRKITVVTAMYLATSLALVPAGRTAIGSAGVDTLLGAISRYSRDSLVRDTADELLAAVTTDDAVAEVVADLSIVLDDLLESKSKSKAAEYKGLATKAAAFAAVSGYAEMMLRSDGVSTLVSALTDVSSKFGIPEQEATLAASALALVSVASSIGDDKMLCRELSKSGAIKAVIGAIKLHPKLTKSVLTAVSFLETLGSFPDMGDLIADEGGVEACVSALRANANNAEVVASAIQTLLQIASSDKGAVAVAKHGGTRQVIAIVNANIGTPNFAEPMSKAIALLQRVSTTTEGAEILVKQGGVDAIIEATEALAKTSGSASDRSAAARVLARLLTRDDVDGTLEALAELGNSASRGRVPGLDAMKPVLAKVGHMATVGNFASVISADGAKNLAAVIGAVLAKGDDAADAKADVLPLAFKALGNVAKNARVEQAAAFATQIATSVEANFAVVECLEAVANLGANSEAGAYALCSDGRTLPMVVSTLKANLRSREVAPACFKALGSLASFPSAAALVAGTSALRDVSAWVDDNIDEATPEALASALSALVGMANAPAFAASMLDTGSVELVKTVLTKACIETDKPAPAVLASAVTVLSRLGANPAAMTRISAAGALRRVVRAFTAAPEYVKDEAAVEAGLDLIIAAGRAGGAVASELAAIGSMEVVIAGMNANGTSMAVTAKGASALAALGAGPEQAAAALADVTALSAALETAAEITEDMVATLGEAVQRLGNFLSIPGVVTAATAMPFMSALSNAVQLMAETELAKPDVLSAGVRSIGRSVELGGASVEGFAKEAVEMVLDVLSLTDSVVVKESAIFTLGALATSKTGLATMSAAHAIETITQTGRANAGDAKLQAVIASAMTKISSLTSRSAASLVTGSAGASTLAAVFNANTADVAQLSTMLTEVSAVVGGDEAIYDVIASPTTGKEIIAEALRVLRERAEKTGMAVAGNARRMAGLSKALTAALALQTQLTAASDNRTKLLALRLADNTLSLLSRVAFDASGAPVFVAAGGIDSLMQLLGPNIEDEETVAKITTILRSAMAVTNAAGGAAMAKSENIGSIVGTLKLFAPQGAAALSIVADCVEIMGFTARAVGGAASGVDRDGMREVNQAAAAFGDARVRTGAAMLQAAMGSLFAESDAAVRAMASSLTAATAAAASVGSVQEMTAEDGRVYYFNSATQETTWEMPSSFAAFKSSMAAVQTAASKQQEDSAAAVDMDTITNMVSTLNTHMRNATVSGAAAQTLSALSLNDANADAIAKVGGIRTIIAAVNANASNVALVRDLLVLLERISRNDSYKEQIADAGGVEVVVNIAIGYHVGTDEVALKALATIANLAFNSPTNIKTIMSRGGVKAIEKVLQSHPSKPRILENAMCALSNLMFGSDENKKTIGLTCGDEVTNIIRDHPNDANLFKMALRALGNLSFCDENIRFIVEKNSAVKAIVAGMRANPKEEEAQQLAMEVIGNFASLEEDAPEEDANGNIINPQDSISSIILREAGCAQIIKSFKDYPSNTTLLKAGLDALANIANDVEVTETMAKKQGLVPAVIEVMQGNDWDVELITRAVALLGVMTYSRECLTLISQLDGIQVLLSAMEQHGTSPELLSAAQVALTNLAASDDARTAIRNMEGVSTIMALLEANSTDKTYVMETFKTLTRLCADDRLSSAIATDGMHIVMEAIERFQRDTDFLTVAFRLLGHLAFVESNLTVIVQHNGIQKIITAITSHPDCQPLMVRSIQTLDNIAMANRENASIVIEEGGRELIETIMDTFPEDEEITRFGKSALLSMSALENLSKSAEITSKAAKAGVKGKAAEVKKVDPLADYRHSLSAGKVMKVWEGGRGKAAHLVVSPDFKSIVWQEVGTQRKLGAMDLRSVAAIRAGTGEGHKKTMLNSGLKDTDVAFVVVGERTSLDLEANSAKERNFWVDALSKLLVTYRTSPGSL
jgi:hypothetical protein